MTNVLGPWSREELLDSWRAARRESRDGLTRWFLLIKELRLLHDASILEAERIALSNAHRRRWIETQINSHPRCRKYALSHIRYQGDAALIERVGNALRVRVPDSAAMSAGETDRECRR